MLKDDSRRSWPWKSVIHFALLRAGKRSCY